MGFSDSEAGDLGLQPVPFEVSGTLTSHSVLLMARGSSQRGPHGVISPGRDDSSL